MHKFMQACGGSEQLLATFLLATLDMLVETYSGSDPDRMYDPQGGQHLLCFLAQVNQASLFSLVACANVKN